jgi:hypothetical protein
MAKAAADQDFELAAALRDRLVQAKASLFERQVPGRMGLGTDQQAYQPPKGWIPPKKPDLMTSQTKPRRGGRTR